MFFKMLKKDLKNDIGLNIMLFLFISISAVLSVASLMIIYLFFMPYTRTFDACNTSQIVYAISTMDTLTDEIVPKYTEYIKNFDCVESVIVEESLKVLPTQIDVENFDESSMDTFFEGKYCIEKQEQGHNLIVDNDDKSFVLRSGEVAISEYFADTTGAGPRDHIYITTDMGNVYQFEVAHIYKEVYISSASRLIVSDADYEFIKGESGYYGTKYEINLVEGEKGMEFFQVIANDRKKASEADDTDRLKIQSNYLALPAEDDLFYYDTAIVEFIVMVFTVLAAVFMLIIILMTIRFSLISAIENEKKELGMIKAIGADTLGFRWLFAAKYIGFAVVGVAIGIIAGIPTGRLAIKLFSRGRIGPTGLETLGIALVAGVGLLASIVGFTIIVLRSINKISVMEVIHGLDLGESYSKLGRLHISGSKLPVELYLAVSDIRNKFRKYLFLIIAYILAFLIVLCTVNLRDTVMGHDFMKILHLTMQLDFWPDFDEELSRVYLEKTGGGEAFYQCINNELSEAGIPAGYRYDYSCYGSMVDSKGNVIDIDMIFGDYDVNKFNYHQGVAPKLSNELAISYYTAKNRNINIGDIIEIEYNDCSDINGSVRTKKKEKFVVTGFFDLMESISGCTTIMSNEFENGKGDGVRILEMYIDAPESEKADYVAKIKELYGENNIKAGKEMDEILMGEYDHILSIVRNVLSMVAIFVIVLITALYSKILLAGESSEIALLKCMGFSDGSIRKWQMLRGVLLVLISGIIAYAIHLIIGNHFINFVFNFLQLSGFRYVMKPVVTFLIIPVVIMASILIILWGIQRETDKIKLWKIRED